METLRSGMVRRIGMYLARSVNQIPAGLPAAGATFASGCRERVCVSVCVCVCVCERERERVCVCM